MPPGIRSGKTRKEATDFADFTDFTDGKTIWKSGRGEQPYFLTGLGRGGRWVSNDSRLEAGGNGGGRVFHSVVPHARDLPWCGRIAK